MNHLEKNSYDGFINAAEGVRSLGQPSRLLALKQNAYTDPNIFSNEIANIFNSDWITIGRSGSIPNAGDYFTASLGQRPIIIIRQNDGSIQAMANYCIHRYTKLLEGCGSTPKIVCPYHCWVYDINGQLTHVTHKNGFLKEDIEQQQLEPIACGEHLGYIFVSLEQDLPSVSERLKPLTSLLKNFELENYEDRWVVHEEIWNANWKLICQNFLESYHVTYTHTKSIGPANPTRAVEYGPLGHPHFTVHSNSYTPEKAPNVYNPRLTDQEHRRFYVAGVFPNGLIAVEPNFVWWMALEPIAVNQTNTRWGISFSPHTMKEMPQPELFIENVIETVKTATAEDKEMVEKMQLGARFNADQPGLLHASLEINIKEFDDYTKRMLDR